MRPLKREVQEEVGLTLDNAAITLVNSSLSGTSEKTLRETGERVLVDMHFNDFRIDIPHPASEIPVVAGDDFGEIRWVPLTDTTTLQRVPETTQHTLRKLGYS